MISSLKGIGLFTAAFLIGMLVAAFVKWPPLQSSDWAAWVQAIGSLLGLAVAVGIALYQSVVASKAFRDSELQKRTDAHNQQIRVLETAKELILAMERVLRSIIQMESPSGFNGGYNRRADTQTIVTLGDLLKALPLLDIHDNNALLAVAGALGQVDRYRIMIDKNAFNAPLGVPEQFRLHSDTLVRLLGEIRAKRPTLPVHH